MKSMSTGLSKNASDLREVQANRLRFKAEEKIDQAVKEQIKKRLFNFIKKKANELSQSDLLFQRVYSQNTQQRSSNQRNNQNRQDELGASKTKKRFKSRKTDQNKNDILGDDMQSMLDATLQRYLTAEKRNGNIDLSKRKWFHNESNNNSHHESFLSGKPIHQGSLEHQTNEYEHVARLTDKGTKKQHIQRQQILPENNVRERCNSEWNRHERSKFRTQLFNTANDFFVGSQNTKKPLQKTQNAGSPFKTTKNHREQGRGKNSFMNNRNNSKRRFITSSLDEPQVFVSSRTTTTRASTFKTHPSDQRSHSRNISHSNAFKQPFQDQQLHHSQNYGSPISKQKQTRKRSYSRGASRKRSKHVYSTQIYRKRVPQTNSGRIPRDFCRYLRDGEEIEGKRDDEEKEENSKLEENSRRNDITERHGDSNETNAHYYAQNSLRKSMNLVRNHSSSRKYSRNSTIHNKSPRRLERQRQRLFLYLHKNTDDSLEHFCPSTEQLTNKQTKQFGEKLNNPYESDDNIEMKRINNNSEQNQQQQQLLNKQTLRSPVINSVLKELDIMPVCLGPPPSIRTSQLYSPIMKLRKPIGLPPKTKASTAKVEDTTNPSKIKCFHKKKVLFKPASLIS